VELDGWRAVVELNGVRREANVAFVPGARVGDHVLVHAGFAIQKWSDEDAAEYALILREAGVGP
jgi:hydrogenase expression/formation protein HypC